MSSSQFIGTFVGLQHMLVLERSSGLRTVIVPHINYTMRPFSEDKKHVVLEAEKDHVNEELKYKSFSVDAEIPFFAFDEDPSLRQMRPNGTETYPAWLTCAYLHAATSSCLKDPLTGLTGLEMAVSQLRRCYVNKPLDEICYRILNKIKLISVRRVMSCGVEITLWNPLSSYSNSDVYVLIADMIRAKSLYLQELYPKRDDQKPKQKKKEAVIGSEFAAKAYANYEWVYSADARLNAKEKRELAIDAAKAPEFEFATNIQPNMTLTYKLVHAARCRIDPSENSTNFSWLRFFQSFNTIEPYKAPDQHVGDWSCRFTIKSARHWLSLCVAASQLDPNDPLALERFTFMLSFIVWKLEKSSKNPENMEAEELSDETVEMLNALKQLLRLAMARNSHWPQSSDLPSFTVRSPNERFLDETRVNFGDALSEPAFANFLSRTNSRLSIKSHVNNLIWREVKACDVWQRDGHQLTAKALLYPSCFDNIGRYVAELTADDRRAMMQQIKSYHEQLYGRQQMYNYTKQLDRMGRLLDTDHFEAYCSWQCHNHWPLVVEVEEPHRNGVDRLADPDEEMQVDSVFQCKTEILNGRCVELEEDFQNCLVAIERGDVKTAVEFPLRYEEDSIQLMNRSLTLHLKNSWEQFQLSREQQVHYQPAVEIRTRLENIKEKASKLAVESWRWLENYFVPEATDFIGRAKRAVGLSSFVAPRTLFPRFGRESEEGASRLPSVVRNRLEEHLLCVVYSQKAIRCLEMLNAFEALAEEDRRHYADRLTGEIRQAHCSGWNPGQRPKWLLFEVEWNLIIRSVQAVVAEEIIAGNQQILQLNMGEGKTSVISPLVCSSLSNRQLVVRLTLLTSLLESHGQELAIRLGGLLEQNVYYFPCNRDIQFTPELTTKMEAKFNECLSGEGCVLTAPEHRLSMLLKFEEMCIGQAEEGTPNQVNRVNNADVAPNVDNAAAAADNAFVTLSGEGLLNFFQLQEQHLVDIVDESDEILRYKYQLLYTVGSQQAVDGGSRRWKVVQEMLNLVRRNADRLRSLNNSDQDQNVIIYSPAVQGSASWPYIRVVDERGNDKIRRLIVVELLAGQASDLSYMSTMNSKYRQLLEQYLLNEPVTKQEILYMKRKLSDQQWKDLMIVRGLLSTEILLFCLKKRWSVDYGVDVKTKRRLMAVPFRGKDTPIERTEFGHTDVGIVFSHLSYYYSGLSDEQMKDALTKMKSQSQRDSEYQTWTDASAAEEMAEHGIIADVNAINLDDDLQLKKLTAFFRFNTSAIHFWLNTSVLPKETKQFPYKLVATSWDLARAQSQPMRGFSGTKDSCRLLPLHVSLGSLPQLEGTDGDVLARVTSAENRKVFELPADVSADQVVNFIVDSGRRGSAASVLIDVGALMVGMTNQQVAQYWLSKSGEHFVAAVYFEGNQVMVVLRDGHTSLFNFSPLKQCLQKVLIYMDDIHTRGTDFKFPIPTRAFVTLGRDLPKDKLVQACMRMRQLGHGHCVSFLAPKEIYAKLQDISPPQQQPDSRQVIEWSLSNTSHQLENGMLEWASQGIVYSRRLTANELVAPPSRNSEHLQFFSFLSKVAEANALEDMYSSCVSNAPA